MVINVTTWKNSSIYNVINKQHTQFGKMNLVKLAQLFVLWLKLSWINCSWLQTLITLIFNPISISNNNTWNSTTKQLGMYLNPNYLSVQVYNVLNLQRFMVTSPSPLNLLSHHLCWNDLYSNITSFASIRTTKMTWGSFFVLHSFTLYTSLSCYDALALMEKCMTTTVCLCVL